MFKRLGGPSPCSSIVVALAVFAWVGGASADKQPLPAVGYEKGFFIQSPDANYKLKIGARVQARYAYTANEGFDAGEDDDSAFSIPRARLTLGGNVFKPGLTYKFQTDFGKGFVSLKDFYVDYRITKGWLHVRAGQWKRAFSRQQLNSSGRLELVDRAITDKAFGAGRDIGVGFHNGAPGAGLEWALGLFNATGDKATFSGSVDATAGTASGKFTNIPDFFGPALVARVGWNHGGIKGYSEGDLEGGGFRFAVAASTVVEFDADDDDDSGIRAELDAVAKIAGFAVTAAVYVGSEQDGAEFADQSYRALGAHVSASFVIHKMIQPVLRYATVMPEGDDNDVHEVVAGISLYMWGHKLKWQNDFTALLTETAGDTRKDYVVRSQLQLAF